MTYNVFSGTLNPTQSINHLTQWYQEGCMAIKWLIVVNMYELAAHIILIRVVQNIHYSPYIISTIGKKNLVSSNISSTCPSKYGELRPTSGWDRFGSLGHPIYFQQLPRLGSVTARHVVVGVSQTAALNRGRHLCLAGRPSRWALAHISSFCVLHVVNQSVACVCV